MKRHVLIVEDQTLMASLLSDAFTDAGFSVSAAADVPSALDAIEDVDPDAAVLDFDLGPGATGFDLGTVLARTRPDIALLFLTDKPESAMMPFHAADLPPNAGFLVKSKVANVQSVIDALEAVLSDQPELARHEYETPCLIGLSPEQHELLRDVAMGLTNAVIARRHGVAESTVERWIVTLFRQLGICSRSGVNPRVEAARRYIAACGLPTAT